MFFKKICFFIVIALILAKVSLSLFIVPGNVSTDFFWLWFLALLVGYFWGSIPSGWVIMKTWHGKDIRYLGSGNIGATNVWRSGSKKGAFLTLALDVLKGVLGVFSSTMLLKLYAFNSTQDIVILQTYVMSFLLMAPLLGHIYPLWFSFKGGKGIATCLGLLLLVSPLALGVFLLTWGAVFVFTRISSLAAMVSLVTLPMVVTWTHDGPWVVKSVWFYEWSMAGFLPWLWSVCFICLYQHKENIQRLIKGQEGRL